MLNNSKFNEKLLKWNREKSTRKMPWKGEKDPYKIWLSEIILQQTRVLQGLSYYERFIREFPTIQSLANADEKKVYKLWEGLGYYSRCRNLIDTAKYIANEKSGVFPDSYEEILKLKGVGSYTASAIASFAYNLPYAVLDGNVFRVLSRIFGVDKSIDSTEGKKYFNQLCQQLLNKKNPGAYNQAIMDFGATVCKPVNPNCSTCIFKKSCYAHLNGLVALLPIKSKTLFIKIRKFYFLVVKYKNTIVVTERKEKDIWQNLHGFPVVEANEGMPVEDVVKTAKKSGLLGNDAVIDSVSTAYRQKLTHQSITAIFISVKVKRKPEMNSGLALVDTQKLKEYSFPKIINDYRKDADL